MFKRWRVRSIKWNVADEGVFTNLDHGAVDLVPEYSGCIKVGDGLLPQLDEGLWVFETPCGTVIGMIIPSKGPPFNPVCASLALVAGDLVDSHWQLANLACNFQERRQEVLIFWAKAARVWVRQGLSKSIDDLGIVAPYSDGGSTSSGISEGTGGRQDLGPHTCLAPARDNALG